MIKKLLKTTLVVSLLLFASCSPKTEYTHALPKNASVVVAMELDEMAQKAGLNESGGEKVVMKLKTLLKGGLQGEAAQLADRIIGQPSESGLSFDDKVYLFATPHAEALAILAKVADEDKMESLLKVLEKESIANPLREDYLMIGAFTAVALNFLAAVKCVCYYIRNKRGSKNMITPIFFTALIVVTSIMTWDGWYSVFIMAGLVINSIAFSLSDAQTIRKLNLIKAPLCLFYNIAVLSVGGIIYESATFMSSVIGIIKNRKTKN